MRIRKRFLHSSLSSLPLSDPQLTRSPVVQPQLPGGVQVQPQANLGNPQPCHLANPTIGSERARWVSTQTELKVEGEEVKEGRCVEEEGKSSNDTGKGGSILGTVVGTALLPPLPGSSDQERWDVVDKSVPLKKRRVSFERERETKVKAKMKSKTNKKLLPVQCENGDEEQEEEEDDDDDDGGKEGSGSSSKNVGGLKKLKRGNVIMEGSRCSRVNGRGWRCFQQTLVGYSLCEHHLGKGRLRSMTSVRSRATKKVESECESEVLLKQNGDYDFEDDDETTKKKVKLGVVKARSMSSLLGQTNNAMAVVDSVKNIGV
ncbi:hypothetical protein NMG60_11001857 [Bertholletia excelsa]